MARFTSTKNKFRVSCIFFCNSIHVYIIGTFVNSCPKAFRLLLPLLKNQIENCIWIGRLVSRPFKVYCLFVFPLWIYLMIIRWFYLSVYKALYKWITFSDIFICANITVYFFASPIKRTMSSHDAYSSNFVRIVQNLKEHLFESSCFRT